jgi:integrase/recombinase XerD
MNVQDLVTHFVAFRQTLGERFETNARILRSFCRAVGPQTRITRIRSRDVVAFLFGTASGTRSRRNRYLVLKGFFQFAVSRGHLAKMPLPPTAPKRPPAFAPYIYSRAEIRRLLDAIAATQGLPSRMEPITMRAMLLLMYGAGLRPGETLHLSAADVDLANALLTIRNTKFFKSRLVPIGPDLTQVLSEYVRWRAVAHPSVGGECPFFVGGHGGAVHRSTLQRAFMRLREHAGIRRGDGGHYQPRLHDLRHAFAVARLTEWYRQGADVQRLVYHLSVYLGHARLTDTQVYLTMTPELLRQASTRFERYARQEDYHE